MSGRIGRLVLVVSGLGFPLTQLTLNRFGRRGALVVEAVSVGLLARDAVMLATGTPGRLRGFPALLLWLEAATGVAAALAGLRPILSERGRQQATGARPDPFEAVRRAAVGALFGLHTWRFHIYLQPDHGSRSGRR